MKTTKRIIAWLLCLTLVLGLMPALSVSAVEQSAAVGSDGDMTIYAKPGETTFVPAGYTYVCEGENGELYTHEVGADVYMTGRVLTAEEAGALAALEYGSETHLTGSNGQDLVCREYDAAEAAKLSSAVKEILEGTSVSEGDTVGIVSEPYSASTPVRVLITFEDAPVIRMDGMTVSVGKGLGDAEVSAVKSIEVKQQSVLQRAEKSIGCEIAVDSQFTLLTNAVSATVNYGDLAAIRNTPGVASAVLMPCINVPDVDPAISDGQILEPNMKFAGPGMGGEAAWNLDYKGEGTSVAILDTGLSYMNPVFK